MIVSFSLFYTHLTLLYFICVDIKAPENVLFVCKLNSITQDEDLELIFSRFDPNVKVEIIRDHETGASLQYAFCEFYNKETMC